MLDHGEIRNVGVAHADPDTARLARRVHERQARARAGLERRLGRARDGPLPADPRTSPAGSPQQATPDEELADDGARARRALVDRRAARGPRTGVRRAHARDRPTPAGASPSRTSRSPRISRGAPRSRSTTPGSTASSTTSRTPCSRACCPGTLTQPPGMEIVARYRPAGEGAEVGGDFYDSWQIGDHYFLAIGDVAGHGPAAAALTSLTRQSMRVVSRYEQSPSRILAVVNDTIRAADRPEQFCTAALAVAAPDRRTATALTVSCAGHPPPVVVRAGRRHVEEVGVCGPLLGVLAAARVRRRGVPARARRPRRVLDGRRHRAPARRRHVRRGAAARAARHARRPPGRGRRARRSTRRSSTSRRASPTTTSRS